MEPVKAGELPQDRVNALLKRRYVRNLSQGSQYFQPQKLRAPETPAAPAVSKARTGSLSPPLKAGGSAQSLRRQASGRFASARSSVPARVMDPENSGASRRAVNEAVRAHLLPRQQLQKQRGR